MEKRTIIWEENNEPPKNYIWVKSDGKAYEYNNNTRSWELSKIIGASANGGSGTDSAAPHVYEVSSLEDIESPKEGDIAITEPEVLESIISDVIFNPPVTKVTINKKKDFPVDLSFTGVLSGGPNSMSLFSATSLYPLSFDGSTFPYSGLTVFNQTGTPQGETLDDYLEVIAGDRTVYEYYGEEWKERVDAETIKESSQTYTKNNSANTVSIVQSPKEGDIEEFVDKIGIEITNPNTTQVYYLNNAGNNPTSLTITCPNPTVQTGISKAKLCFTYSNAVTPTTPKYTIESDGVYYGLKVTDEDTGNIYYIMTPTYAQMYGNALPSNYVTKLVLPIPYTENNMGGIVYKSYWYNMAIQEDTSEGSTYSILNYFALTSLLPGVAKEYYNGKWETRSKPLTQQDLNDGVQNKQAVFTIPTEQIINPKEGDIIVQPSTYTSINPEVTTSMGGGYISKTWDLSPWIDKTIKIENASGGMSSGITVTYTNDETELISMTGSNLEAVVTNVISASSSGMSNVNFNFYVAQEQPIKEYYNGEWIDRNTAQRTYTFENPGNAGSLPTYDILNPKYGDVAYCDEELFANIQYSTAGEQTVLSASTLYGLKIKIEKTSWVIYPTGTITITFGDNSGWIIYSNKIESFGSGWASKQFIENWSNSNIIYLDLPPSVTGWMGDTVTCTQSNANDYWFMDISCVYPAKTSVYDGVNWVNQTTTIEALNEKVTKLEDDKVILTGLPTADMNENSEALAGIGITPNNIMKLSKGNVALIVKDLFPLGDYADHRMNILYSYFYSTIYCRLIFADNANKYDILFEGSVDPSVTITSLS